MRKQYLRNKFAFYTHYLYLMPRREYFENNPIQKDDTAQSANAYMSLSGRNRRFSKHEIKTFFTSSIVFLNL